jgi:hypothetical protein
MNTDLEAYVKLLSGKKVPAKPHTKGKGIISFLDLVYIYMYICIYIYIYIHISYG